MSYRGRSASVQHPYPCSCPLKAGLSLACMNLILQIQLHPVIVQKMCRLWRPQRQTLCCGAGHDSQDADIPTRCSWKCGETWQVENGARANMKLNGRSVSQYASASLEESPAHLLVLLDLYIDLRGCVWEGAPAIGFPEKVCLSHLCTC